MIGFTRVAARYEAEARFFGERRFARVEGAALDLLRHPSRPTLPVPDPWRRWVKGGGLMGAGIATVSAPVRAVPHQEVDPAAAARAKSYVAKVLSERVRRKRMRGFDAEQVQLRITTTTDWSGFANADLVIEAVFEDLELKRQLLREVEGIVSPETVFASNTSSIPIREIAAASSRPETVGGMHYFSPVEKMPLLEVIVTDQTSKEAGGHGSGVRYGPGKTVIVVNDSPGFYTTRILGSTGRGVPPLAEGARWKASTRPSKHGGSRSGRCVWPTRSGSMSEPRSRSSSSTPSATASLLRT